MKEDFLKFQLSKNKMNELKGGQVQKCHCGGSTAAVFLVECTTTEELERTMERKCGLNGWACTLEK